MASEGIFALRFGTKAAYDAFADSYREKLFENTFKVENDEINRDKVTRLVHVPRWCTDQIILRIDVACTAAGLHVCNQLKVTRTFWCCRSSGRTASSPSGRRLLRLESSGRLQ